MRGRGTQPPTQTCALPEARLSWPSVPSEVRVALRPKTIARQGRGAGSATFGLGWRREGVGRAYSSSNQSQKAAGGCSRPELMLECAGLRPNSFKRADSAVHDPARNTVKSLACLPRPSKRPRHAPWAPTLLPFPSPSHLRTALQPPLCLAGTQVGNACWERYAHLHGVEVWRSQGHSWQGQNEEQRTKGHQQRNNQTWGEQRMPGLPASPTPHRRPTCTAAAASSATAASCTRTPLLW